MDMRYSLLGLTLVAGAAAAAPQAVDDIRSIPANTPITIDVLNNDSDDEGLTFNLDTASVTTPANGSVVVNPDGGITYTPNDGFTGRDTFTYQIISDGEVPLSAQATVTINVVASVLSGSVVGSNINSVGQSIDAVCSALGAMGDSGLTNGQVQLSARCDELSALALANPEAAAAAVRKIAPEETLSMAKVGVNASQFQAKAIGARLAQLGQGLSAANSGGLSWSGALGGGAAGDGSLLSKFGYFASVQIEDADKDTNLSEAGFDYSAESITAGIDFAATKDWFLGAAMGFTANELMFKDNGGQIDTEIVNFIAYSTYNMGNFSADVQLGSGNSDIDVWRNISYDTLTSSFRTTTSGNTHGDQWFISSEVQYLYSWNALTLYPSIKYTYMDSTVAAYADTNAGGWEVELGEQHVVQNTLEVGLQATYAINASWGVFIPNFEFNAYDDLDTDQDMLEGSFAFATDSSESFGMFAEAPDSYYYQMGLGFSVVLPNGVSGFAGYSETLGYTDYSANQFQAGFRMEF